MTARVLRPTSGGHGLCDYGDALALMEALAGRAADAPDLLLSVEHPPTITLGAHADPSHVLADPADRGVEVFHVDRGGASASAPKCAPTSNADTAWSSTRPALACATTCWR